MFMTALREESETEATIMGTTVRGSGASCLRSGRFCLPADVCRDCHAQTPPPPPPPQMTPSHRKNMAPDTDCPTHWRLAFVDKRLHCACACTHTAVFALVQVDEVLAASGLLAPLACLSLEDLPATPK